MTYIVTDNCIACKYTDCVEVCPVDCFYEGENMLVIHPDECIDCGVCEPECPAEAIKPDTEPGLDKWLKINAEFAQVWPNITVKKDAMPGRLNETWFRATKTGVFYGQCSELCGVKHGFMPIELHVVSKEDYQLWLEGAKKKFSASLPSAQQFASIQ